MKKGLHMSGRTTVRERTEIRRYRHDAYLKQDGKCIYCTEQIKLVNATADHIKPRSSGGITSKSNIDAVCYSCNQLKGSWTKAQFNMAINAPSYKRDGFELHMDAMSVRLKKQSIKACDNIRKMFIGTIRKY